MIMEVLIILILLAMTLHVIVTIPINNFLRERELDTNFLLLRSFANSNALLSKKITKKKPEKQVSFITKWIPMLT